MISEKARPGGLFSLRSRTSSALIEKSEGEPIAILIVQERQDEKIKAVEVDIDEL